MTHETPKMSKARLLDLPIQIEASNICTNHPECKQSKEIFEAINASIENIPRHVAAFSIAEYLIRLFVKDGFEQSPSGAQSEDRLKAGIRAYIETAFDYVQTTELELIETTNHLNSKGMH